MKLLQRACSAFLLILPFIEFKFGFILSLDGSYDCYVGVGLVSPVYPTLVACYAGSNVS